MQKQKSTIHSKLLAGSAVLLAGWSVAQAEPADWKNPNSLHVCHVHWRSMLFPQVAFRSCAMALA